MRPAPSAPLDVAVELVGSRLRTRRTVRWAVLGGWIGALLSALWLGAWLMRWAPLPHFAWLLAPLAGTAAIAALIGRSTFKATTSDLALLVDRLLDSEEVAITALELRDGAPGTALAGQVLADSDLALEGRRTELKGSLPVGPPRHVRFLPLALLAVAAMTFLPRAPLREKPAGPAGDLAAEAERLEQRKEQLEQELGVEMPDDLDAQMAELIEAMKNGSIGKDDAAQKAQELSDALNDLSGRNADGVSDALEQLAQDLEGIDPELAEDLKDAFDDADLEEAQEAVDRMRERMEQASPEERERAAREMERAAESAMNSPLPGLGGALRSEAGRMRQQAGSGGSQNQGGQQGGQQASGQGQGGTGGQQQGQQGGEQQGSQGGQSQGQGGQQDGQGQQQGGGQTGGGTGQQPGGQQGGQSGGQGGGGLSEYLEQLEQQGLGGDGLAQEEAQSQMQQQMEQALGGAAGRLGGKGATGQQGHGQGGDQASWGAGTGHTDEDAGTFDTTGRSHQDMDRQVDGRTSDWVVPFDQQHAPERLDGVEAVASTVDVPLGDGPVDVETFRLEGSQERSGAPLLQAPDGYREAAEEAIDGESIPRAYRDQVKTYFDAIE